MNETFNLFLKYCKFSSFGREEGEWIDTCTKKSQIPDGHSWGKCNIYICPFFQKLIKSHNERKTN